MNEYNNLIRSINRARQLIDDEDKEIEVKCAKLVASSEIEELIKKRIDIFLNTTRGRILGALGFNSKYICEVIIPIIKDIGPETAEIYKKL
jgi:hypothetical protein